MGESGPSTRVRWTIAVLIAAALTVVLVVLSTPPEMTLQEGPGESGGEIVFHQGVKGRVLCDRGRVAATVTLQVFARISGWLLRHGLVRWFEFGDEDIVFRVPSR